MAIPASRLQTCPTLSDVVVSRELHALGAIVLQAMLVMQIAQLKGRFKFFKAVFRMRAA